MSKRRRGYPSETGVKRGHRAVKGGNKELTERLGNNDLCPCGSARRFQELLPEQRPLSTESGGRTTSGSSDHHLSRRTHRPPLALVAQRKSSGFRTRAQRFDPSRGLLDTVAERRGARLQPANDV